MRTLLIDGDVVAYQYAAAAQKVYKWDGVTPSISIEQTDEEIEERVSTHIADAKALLGADEIVMCLSDPASNWRKAVLPSYKANRDPALRPLKLPWVRSLLADNYRTKLVPGLEGDDVMGILSTHPKIIKGEKIIWSIDKDMKTIPGLLFNPGKDRKPSRISPEEADYWHMFQTLTGDTVDNYKGCPGIGKVKAEAILHAPNGELLSRWLMWQAVVVAYENAGLTEADALVQAQVAAICRHTNFNFKTRRVVPWHPPK